jgi:hypothetical protein
MNISKFHIFGIDTRILFLLSAFLVVPIASAKEEQSILTFKGFGSLVGTGTDTDEVGFRRDVTRSGGVKQSWDITNDSRLGLQVDAKISESLQATVQWVARDHAGDFVEQNLDWAFLRWSAQPDWVVRIGRLGIDVFMLSDYRNVGYAYPWIRPPHEFYGNLPLYHIDGIDTTKKFDLGDGILSLKAFAGYSFNTLTTSLPNLLYEQESLNIGGNIQFEKNDWRVKASYVHLEMMTEVPIQPLTQALENPQLDAVWPGRRRLLPLLPILGKEFNYSSLGAAYDDGTWMAQAEGSYIATNTTWYPDQASGYLSFGRHFSKFTLYSILGITKSLTSRTAIPQPLTRSIPEINQLYGALDTAFNSNGVNEKSVSLGLRWDFYTNMAFKAEWNHYWFDSTGDSTWIKYTEKAFPHNVNVFSVGVDFIF